MTEMVDDETIYEGFAEEPSDREIEVIKKLMNMWADSMDGLPMSERSVKLVFGACINVIATMGPAYCRIAATTLLQSADEQDEEDDT
jgi:hypothetical protein